MDAALEFTMGLMTFMQLSTLVPMLVVWWRRRHFPAAIKLLSWYVYLSAAMSAVGHLYPVYMSSNYGSIIGFNIGKIILLVAVYQRVLLNRRLSRFLVVSSVVATAASLALAGYDGSLAVSVVRVLQCALLAGCALAYLSQILTYPTGVPATRDPLWLLSVGQLVYSAGTVTAFSLDYLSMTKHDQISKYIFIAVAGLVFNIFLTMTFLRSRVAPDTAAEAATQATRPLVASR